MNQIRKEKNAAVRPERIPLGEGITLYHIPCYRFKTNAVSLRILCPLTAEAAAVTALLPFVLKRGTKRLPSQLLFTRETERLYGTGIHPLVGKLGGTQYIGFSALPLREEYTEGQSMSLASLSLMAEMLYEPYLEDGCLSSAYLDSEKRVMIDRVRAKINDKGSYAVFRCREEMGRGDVASHPETGTVPEIEAVTPSLLTERLRELLSSCRIEIYCAGAFDREALIRHCSALFVRGQRRLTDAVSFAPLVPQGEAREVVEELPTMQGKLCLGFLMEEPLTAEKAPAFTLFLEVLANAPTAKLFVNVRERLSLCYYCSAVPDRVMGTLILTSGIEVADRDKAQAAILAELDACRRGEISDGELNAARKSVLTSLKSIYDDPSSLIHWFFRRAMTGSSVTPDEYADMVSRVTLNDLRRIADSLILDTVYFLKGTLTGGEDENE